MKDCGALFPGIAMRTKNESELLARQIRIDSLRMTHRAGASHVGTCLSMADILAVLYSGIVRVDAASPLWANRDRVILSKGHGAAAFYSALARTGFFPPSELDTFCQDGSNLMGHVSHHVAGVDFSTGSLGHGLSLGCGVALGSKRANSPVRAFVVMSDGECDEGSVWEAALFAPHHRLSNLVAIIDYNKIQSFGKVEDVLRLEPFAAKWAAFNWGVREIDGHDHAELFRALASTPFTVDRPSIIIAHTIKGKGVSFMEDTVEWHYRSPNPEQLQRALNELTETST